VKILFLATELERGLGGIKLFNRYFLKVLSEEANDLVVITYNDTEINEKWHFQVFPCAGYGFWGRFVFAFCALTQAFIFKPAVIICGHISFLPVVALISMFCRRRVKVVVVAHGVELKVLDGFKRQLFRRSDLILSVSRFTRGWVLRQLRDYPSQRVVVVGNTFDSNRFSLQARPQHLVSKFSVGQEDKVILTVARLAKSERYKGYDKVILALKVILPELPNVYYFIVGQGDDLPRLKKMVKDLSLENRVVFCEGVSDEELPDYYALCDVFVMPSRFEGFGIVFLEALSCGKPVIAGSVDGSSDALLDGRLGILVDPDNLMEIKEAILKVLKGQLEDKFFDREYLRRTVIEHFGFDAFRRRLKCALEHVQGRQ